MNVKKIILGVLVFTSILLGTENNVIAATSAGTFCDVPHAAWYVDDVKFVATHGFMVGPGNGMFLPNDDATIKEGVILLARLVAYQEGVAFSPQDNGFQPYYHYLHEKGLIGDMAYPPDGFMSREAFIELLAGIGVPEGDAPINNITFLPDYDTASSLGIYILKLYNSGIITGIDIQGSFSKNKAITRAELAAIIHRLLVPGQRISFTPCLPEGLEVHTIPIPECEWEKGQIVFNDYYIAIKKLDGSSKVFDLTGNLLGTYMGDVLLSSDGDLDIYRVESIPGTQVSYYKGSQPLNGKTYYRGGEFREGLAIVQPDTSPHFEVIDKMGMCICEFSYPQAESFFPKILPGGFVWLDNKYEPESSTTLLECQTGQTLILPISRFYGFNGTGLALVEIQEEDRSYFGYMNSEFELLDAKCPYGYIPMDDEHAFQRKYELVADYRIEDRMVYAVLNQNFQVILPANTDRNLLYANSAGKVLFYTPERDGLFSIDINTEQISTIWDGVVRPEFNVFFNDAFIIRSDYTTATDGTFCLFDYDGNRVSPMCQTPISLGSSAALYSYNGQLMGIFRR